MNVKEKVRRFFSEPVTEHYVLKKDTLRQNVELPPIKDLSKMILTKQDLEREIANK